MSLPKGRNPKRVGGSDVAAICGISDWASPIQVWCRMTGREIPKADYNEAMDWGNRLERPILQSLADDLGVEFETGIVINHPTRRECISPDGFKKGTATEEGLYAEVKNLAWFKRRDYGAPGSEEIDRQYLMQVHHGLSIFHDLDINISKCHFRALFGGQQKGDFTIHYDSKFVELIRTIVDEFLDAHVKTDTPPEPDHTEAYYTFLCKEYPAPEEAAEKVYIDSTPEIDVHIDQRYKVEQELKKLAEEKQHLTNVLCNFIGDKYGIKSPFGKFIWYAVKGKPQLLDIITEIQEAYNIDDDQIAFLKEEHRGDAYKVSRFYPSKEFKEIADE